MSLQDRLDRIREGSKDKIPSAAQEVMKRSAEQLQNSGILASALHEGQSAPAFALHDSEGEVVGLNDLLQRGVLVLNFFRGHW